MTFNRQTYFDIISGKRTDLFARVCRVGLSILEMPYSFAMQIRNFLFDKGLRKIHKLDVPVISVGNLTVGGTGKTPFVAWLAQKFLDEGKLPAIVSRGYHADETGWNDEAKELKLLLPDVPQAFSKKRFMAAQKLLSEHNRDPNNRKIDVIILDDGFQHRKLFRNHNILLVDATNPFGYARITPRGLLREPISGLRRADIVVLSRANAVDAAKKDEICCKIKQVSQIDAAEATFFPRFLFFQSGEKKEIDVLAGAEVLAFCGLGNTGAFFRTVTECSCRIKAALTFPDHYHYTSYDIEGILAAASRENVRYIVCSLKDMVKIGFSKEKIPYLCAIVIKADVPESVWDKLNG